ncbi:alpha/beta hydrolase [Pedobacter aquatilis]|uniref:alpha/beta fold hydrolase n=1 Tax=Pedobacter aquatilis TaxID=351343 RepID=UPI0029300773|nr:alpha/beta hydrolase [Pedobacter aquatilis]
MAIKYPEYVNKLMITGANLNPTEQAVDKAMLAQVRKDLKELIKKDDAESQQVARLLKMLLAEPNIDSQDLHKITASCLIMAGEKDIIKQAHTKLIADNINNSKLVIFKNESHMVPEENAELFNQTVLNFLNEGIN